MFLVGLRHDSGSGLLRQVVPERREPHVVSGFGRARNLRRAGNGVCSQAYALPRMALEIGKLHSLLQRSLGPFVEPEPVPRRPFLDISVISKAADSGSWDKAAAV